MLQLIAYKLNKWYMSSKWNKICAFLLSSKNSDVWIKYSGIALGSYCKTKHSVCLFSNSSIELNTELKSKWGCWGKQNVNICAFQADSVTFVLFHSLECQRKFLVIDIFPSIGIWLLIKKKRLFFSYLDIIL